MQDLEQIRTRLERAGQAHVLRFWTELTGAQQRALLDQLRQLPIEALPELARDYVHRVPAVAEPARLEPPTYYPRNPADPARPWDAARYRAAGEAALRAGRVGLFTVAGGQGTRLGFDGPKGCFPAGAVTGKSLFQILAEGVLAVRRRYDCRLPWCLMTSPQNHDATVQYFRAQDYFGLDPATVHFVTQGVMPSLELGTGRLLLAARGEVATHPDGHGGAFAAMARSGLLDELTRAGVAHLSYVQVDNPLVRIADPVFLGLHIAAPDSSAEMSSRMLPKASPDEKVGVFCRDNGRLRIVEYSDLPEELAHQREPDGALRFRAGNPAIHVIAVEFARRVADDPAFQLPFHRAEKIVPYIDLDTGRRVAPERPNAVKLERFIFDALPLCRAPILYETDRDEFAPIKNASGPDSPETCRRQQTRRAARWLEAAGVAVPRDAHGEPDCVLEISPLTALEPEDLRRRDLPRSIERGARVAL